MRVRIRLLVRLLVAVTALAAALAVFVIAAGPAAAQDDEGSALEISGTSRADGETITGVRYIVSIDGQPVGEGITDADGAWTVAISEAGIYLVTIDVSSLPDGVTLRDPDVTEREVEITNKSKGALFALTGSTDAGAGTGSEDDAATSTTSLYIDRAVSGLRVGALVALASVGLSLIYGVTGLVNFAHAEMVGFGAIIAWTLESVTNLPLLVVAPFGVLAGALLGFILERGLFAPLRQRKLSVISLMVVSIGLSFFLRYLYLLYFGSTRRFFEDYRIQSNYDIGPFSLPPKDYIIIAVSLGVLTLVGLFLQRSKLGTAMRAVSDNRDLAESSGIDVKRTIVAVWISGSALAALAGVLIGVTQQVSWQMGERQLLLIFAAVTLGGLGTAYGAMVGGLAIGFASEMSTLWLDNDLKFLVALTVLILILIVRPQGILGQRERLG